MELIGGKTVFIVGDHHRVLEHWASARRDTSNALTLISLDHHVDGVMAFRSLAGRRVKARNNGESTAALVLDESNNRVAEIRWDDEESIRAAMNELRHDEHVDAAVSCGIFSHAVFLSIASSPKMAPNLCAPYVGCDCEKFSHDEECERSVADVVIDSSRLGKQLQKARHSHQLPEGFDEGHILDIDLDLFHTWSALKPPDLSEFYGLIRRAAVITIACEAWHVHDLWLDDGDPDVDAILDAIREHIRAACEPNTDA